MKTVLLVGQLKEETKDKFLALDGYEFYFYENPKEVPEEIFQKAEILISQPNPEMIQKMPNLYWIQLFSAGANGFDWIPKNIKLSNAYGAYGLGIAEYLVATSLTLLKGLPNYYHLQTEHIWDELPFDNSISKTKVIAVGMGAIGSNYLRNMHALGATCYGVKRKLTEKPDYVEEIYTFDTMGEILSECDIVALCLPETKETIHLFDKARLKSLSKDAILLNVGRGTAIVTEDLLDVIKEGHLKGVYLDVTDPEPLPKNHPLWNTERVYITPHISGRYWNEIHYDNVISVIIENLIHESNNEPLLHIVDRELEY